MNVKKLGIGVISSILLIFLFYFYMNKNIVITQTQFIMNTTIEIKLFGKNSDKQKLEKTIAKAFDVMKEVEDNSTSYVEYEGNAASLNAHRGEYYTVNTDLIDQLSTSIPFCKLTSGEFDIGLFRTVNIWKNGSEKNYLPTRQETLNSLGKSTPDDIVVDKFNSRVLLPADMEIDLGGVSKGYGLDRVISFLKNSDINSALINAGGNIIALGQPVDRNYYNIAVQDPQIINKIIGTVQLHDGEAIATSGSYNRYYDINGKKYSHILSGKTGYPTELYKSVTVITNKGIISDILSTSLFLLSIDDGRDLINKLDYPIEVLYVLNDDTIVKSEGFNIEYSQDNIYKNQ
ncbi:MAG: FAD:protein FMN transferase [Firmicutes bacterium]|nr:FAD:protein FMN transferase [Bacillota bacterium]